MSSIAVQAYTIKFVDGELKVPQDELCAISEYFKSVIRSGMRESTLNTIEMVDVEKGDFELMRTFLKVDKVVLENPQTWRKLKVLADRLQQKRIIEALPPYPTFKSSKEAREFIRQYRILIVLPSDENAISDAALVYKLPLEQMLGLNAILEIQPDLSEIADKMVPALSNEFVNGVFLTLYSNNVGQKNSLTRSCVLFNDLFSIYKMETCQEKKSLKEQLKILRRCTRKSVLRSAIIKLKDKYSFINDQLDAVILYCQVALRKKLNLPLAVKVMPTNVPHNFDWVNLKALKEIVELTCVDSMLGLSAVQKLMAADADLQQRLRAQEAALNEAMYEDYRSAGIPFRSAAYIPHREKYNNLW